MSERTLKRILVAVGALVVVYGGVVLLGGGLGGGGDDGAGPLRDLLAGVGPETVEEVRFVRPSDTVRLSRADGGWSVNGRPTDSATVASFWTVLDTPRITGPIARNPSNHSRLGVDTAGAIGVHFRLAGEEERTLLVGETGPSPPSAYVRLPDRDAVHLYHGGIREAARRNVDSWRDRTVVRIDTSRVRTIELVRADGRATLSREGGSWTVGGEPADAAAVEGILGALARLRSTGFAPDTVSLTGAERSLVALDEAGDTLTVLGLSAMEDGTGFMARARGSETIHELTSYQAGRIFPEPDALRAGSDDGAGGDG